MTKRNWEIGKFTGESARFRPNEERVQNYLKSMSNDFKDFDVYLWGSYPGKETWDVDFLLNNRENLDTEQMEDIAISSLEKSLVENNFLADIGFSDKPIVPFTDYRDHYNKTGNTKQNNGYVYADKWFQNGKVFKDRFKFNEGRIERMGNNILKMSSSMPYNKMINTIKDGSFDSTYANKQFLVQPRRKIYG